MGQNDGGQQQWDRMLEEKEVGQNDRGQQHWVKMVENSSRGH